MDLYLRGIHLTEQRPDDESGEAAAELLFTHAHVTIEVIAGEPDGDGGRSIEGFYLVGTEATPEGEPAPDAIRVRLPMDTAAARLLASSLLDYLEQHEVRGTDLTLATAEDVVHLGRAQRRRLERGGR